MTRIPNAKAKKGSQRWLQELVEYRPLVLQPAGTPELEWLSPRENDDWAEYRDGTMLSKLGLDHLEKSLSEFWPRGGPVWDGLARSGETVFLVEAKSHVPEFLSSPSAAKAPQSREMIRLAMENTRLHLGADERSDWTRVFFQYANRLAHLWWLRQERVDAKLLFVSFIGDLEMKGPSASETWDAVFQAADHALGLPAKHPLRKHVLLVHPDVCQWQS